MIRASIEDTPDFRETARLATEAFDIRHRLFDPDHLRWFYEDAFSQGTTVVRLTDGDNGAKIGQIALVRQTVLVNGRPEPAAALVDLFILKQWRGRERVQMLYDEVGRQFEKQKLRFAFGMPNAKALPVNERFFGLKPFLRLEVRAGLALPYRSSRLEISEAFDRNKRDRFVGVFERYRCGPNDTGMLWNGETLYNRLCGFKHVYAVHATQNLLLVSSPRETKAIPYTLLAAFLNRPGTAPAKADVTALARAAALFWKRPLYIYAGYNRLLPALPGISLPDKARPSPMMLQMRDFTPERGRLAFDRFQLIDFDFA